MATTSPSSGPNHDELISRVQGTLEDLNHADYATAEAAAALVEILNKLSEEELEKIRGNDALIKALKERYDLYHGKSHDGKGLLHEDHINDFDIVGLHYNKNDKDVYTKEYDGLVHPTDHSRRSQYIADLKNTLLDISRPRDFEKAFHDFLSKEIPSASGLIHVTSTLIQKFTSETHNGRDIHMQSSHLQQKLSKFQHADSFVFANIDATGTVTHEIVEKADMISNLEKIRGDLLRRIVASTNPVSADSMMPGLWFSEDKVLAQLTDEEKKFLAQADVALQLKTGDGTPLSMMSCLIFAAFDNAEDHTLDEYMIDETNGKMNFKYSKKAKPSVAYTDITKIPPSVPPTPPKGNVSNLTPPPPPPPAAAAVIVTATAAASSAPSVVTSTASTLTVESNTTSVGLVLVQEILAASKFPQDPKKPRVLDADDNIQRLQILEVLSTIPADKTSEGLLADLRAIVPVGVAKGEVRNSTKRKEPNIVLADVTIKNILIKYNLFGDETPQTQLQKYSLWKKFGKRHNAPKFKTTDKQEFRSLLPTAIADADKTAVQADATKNSQREAIKAKISTVMQTNASLQVDSFALLKDLIAIIGRDADPVIQQQIDSICFEVDKAGAIAYITSILQEFAVDLSDVIDEDINDLYQDAPFDKTAIQGLGIEKRNKRIALLAMNEKFVVEELANDDGVDFSILLTELRKSVDTTEVADDPAGVKVTIRKIFDTYCIASVDMLEYFEWNAGNTKRFFDEKTFTIESMNDVEALVPATFSQKGLASPQFATVYKGTDSWETRRNFIVKELNDFIISGDEGNTWMYPDLLYRLRTDDGIVHQDMDAFNFEKDNESVKSEITKLCTAYRIDQSDIKDAAAEKKNKEDAEHYVQELGSLWYNLGENFEFDNKDDARVYYSYLLSEYLYEVTKNAPADKVVFRDVPMFQLGNLKIFESVILRSMDEDLSKKTDAHLYLVEALQHPSLGILDKTNPNTYHRTAGGIQKDALQKEYLKLMQRYGLTDEHGVPIESNTNTTNETLKKQCNNLRWRNQTDLATHKIHVQAHMCYEYLKARTTQGGKVGAILLQDPITLPNEEIGLIASNFGGSVDDMIAYFKTEGLIVNGRFVPDTAKEAIYKQAYERLPYATPADRKEPDYMAMSGIIAGDAKTMMNEICKMLNTAVTTSPDTVIAKQKIITMLEEQQGRDVFAIYAELEVLFDATAMKDLRVLLVHMTTEYTKKKVVNKENYLGYFQALVDNPKYENELTTTLANINEDLAANNYPWSEKDYQAFLTWIADHFDEEINTTTNINSAAKMSELIEKHMMNYLRNIYAESTGTSNHSPNFVSKGKTQLEILEDYVTHTDRTQLKRYLEEDGDRVVKADVKRKPTRSKIAHFVKYDFIGFFSEKKKQKIQKATKEKMYAELYEEIDTPSSGNQYSHTIAYPSLGNAPTDAVPGFGITVASSPSALKKAAISIQITNSKNEPLILNGKVTKPSEIFVQIQKLDEISLGCKLEDLQKVRNMVMYQVMNLVYGKLIESYGDLYNTKYQVTKDSAGFLQVSTLDNNGSNMRDEHTHTNMSYKLEHQPELALDEIINMSRKLEDVAYSMAVNHKTRYMNIEDMSKRHNNKWNKNSFSSLGRSNAFALKKNMYNKGEEGGEPWSFGSQADPNDATATKPDYEKITLTGPEDLSCFTIKNTVVNGVEDRWICATDKSGDTKFYHLKKAAGASDWSVEKEGSMEHLGHVLDKFPKNKEKEEFLQLYTKRMMIHYLEMYKKQKGYTPVPYIKIGQQWYALDTTIYNAKSDINQKELSFKKVTINDHDQLDKASKKSARANNIYGGTASMIFDYDTTNLTLPSTDVTDNDKNPLPSVSFDTLSNKSPLCVQIQSSIANSMDRMRTRGSKVQDWIREQLY